MDIDYLYKSKTRKAIFQLFFSHPQKKYYLRELERILHIPVALVRRELILLEKQGVFSAEKHANLVYYFLNTKYPIYEELKSIVFKTIGIKGELAKILKDLQYVEYACIYGSFAKKKENEESDVDLLLVVDSDNKFIEESQEKVLMKKMHSLEKTLLREIHYVYYPKDELIKKIKEKDSFLVGIFKNPFIMIKGQEDEFRRVQTHIKEKNPQKHFGF